MKLLPGIVFVLLVSAGAACAAESSPTQPNVVLLLADDLGWTGLRCFGSDFYETPHLDHLAASGMKFSSAYAACTVCSPTRASIMTGMYPARLRLTDFIAGQNRPWARLRIPNWTKQLEHKHVTLAEALRDAGYATAHVGKWHLASRNGDSAGAPVTHGFDIQVLKPKQARGYFLPEGFNKDGESRSDYLTDYLTDQALQVIDRHKDRPFFLYFAYHTPHTPIQGRADLVERFKGRVRPDAHHTNPVYAAMVQSLDQSAGRIMDRLRKHGIDGQTIVIFLSDNGGLTQRYGKLDHFTDNAPLRRGKGSAYEGGVRVPTIVRWPGITQPGTACAEPVMSIDLYPTILAMTKTAGEKAPTASVDGMNITSLLKEPTGTLDRDLFWHYPHYHAGGDGPYTAIRSASWRMIQFHEDQSTELYDLSSDIGETTNLAAQMPDRVKDLQGRIDRWRQRIGAQMPVVNPNFDPDRATDVVRRQ